MQYTLGPFNYKEWNFNAKFDEDHRVKRIFNDANVGEDAHTREYLIHMQCTGIFHTSETVPAPEIRRWKGDRELCNNKKNLNYVGREIANDVNFPKFLISVYSTFKGRETIPTDYPPQENALWPLKMANRTIFG